MMYTEIIKIIEGGLSSDRDKVMNYATVLANNLDDQGEKTLSKKIMAVLNKKQMGLTALDSFSTKPVDTESRMDIIEITTPTVEDRDVILNKYSNEAINNFVNGYFKRDILLKSGVDVSNFLLLYGPPGCGKTTVAQYISSITGLPLVTARLDGLVSSLLGSTAKNIRKVFDYASKRECILFLDEFDVIAKVRDDKNELGELKRVVNSLIQNIDSFSNDSILIAATNHQELLDSAIWRRFTNIVTLDKPQKDEIERMLTALLKREDINFADNSKKNVALTEAMVGLSYSDIKTIVINAMRDKVLAERDCLTLCDILKEIYIHNNHMIANEEQFIEYLLRNGATHKEINEGLNIPLRRIQEISKQGRVY